jgi:putative hydrolase of the HAD superfamily
MGQPKVILFDVDGVLVRPPHYFSTELERAGYPRAEECLNAYYRGESQLPCLTGQADARERIAPYLKAFGWEHSADEYFQRQFQFEGEFLDAEMIGIVGWLRHRGVRCGLATDQDAYRAQYLLDAMDFRTLFQGHFISCFVGARKCHAGFWTHVLTELGRVFASDIKPTEIAFFDDIAQNVQTALSLGICARVFVSVPGFRADLAHLGLHLTDREDAI